MADEQHSKDKNGQTQKPAPHESEPLLAQPGPSSSTAPQAPHPDRPRTVRHHRRTLSGRSIRSGHFQFGPSFHPNIYPAVNDPFTRQAKRAADRRARSRFAKALALGVALWVVVGLVLGWTGFQQARWGSGRGRLNYGAKPPVPRSEGHPLKCAKFDSPAPFKADHLRPRMPGDIFRSYYDFLFPLKSGQSFFIHGQGSFAKGHTTIDTWDSDLVKIEVEAVYNDEALIDLMTVCYVAQDGDDFRASNATDKVGLGIYTPFPEGGPNPHSDLEFRIKVQLPNRLDWLSQFEVKDELLEVKISDLSSIPITRFEVESTASSISIGKILSHAVRIQTHNGHIEGTFNISKTLSIHTVNGAIDAQVALFPPSKDDDELPDFPPKPPSNDEQSTKSSNHSASVHATTSNGAVSVKYIEHPTDLKLFSYVASTNGRANVNHTPTYEGDFEVETTWGSTQIKGPFTKKDPEDEGRTRKKLVKSTRNELGYRHVSGTVWWDDGNGDKGASKKGDTVVKTTLGSACITFE